MDQVTRPSYGGGIELRVPAGKEHIGTAYFTNNGYGKYAPKDSESIWAYRGIGSEFRTLIGETSNTARGILTSSKINKWSYPSPLTVQWTNSANLEWDILPVPVGEPLRGEGMLGYKHTGGIPFTAEADATIFTNGVGNKSVTLYFSESDWSRQAIIDAFGSTITSVIVKYHRNAEAWTEESFAIDDLHDGVNGYTPTVEVYWGGNNADTYEFYVYYGLGSVKVAAIPQNYYFTRNFQSAIAELLLDSITPNSGTYLTYTYSTVAGTMTGEKDIYGKINGTIMAVAFFPHSSGMYNEPWQVSGNGTLQYKDASDNWVSLGGVNLDKDSVVSLPNYSLPNTTGMEYIYLRITSFVISDRRKL